MRIVPVQKASTKQGMVQRPSVLDEGAVDLTPKDRAALRTRRRRYYGRNLVALAVDAHVPENYNFGANRKKYLLGAMITRANMSRICVTMLSSLSGRQRG